MCDWDRRNRSWDGRQRQSNSARLVIKWLGHRGLENANPRVYYIWHEKPASVFVLGIERLDLDEIRCHGRIRCADDEGVGRESRLLIIDQSRE